MKWWRSPRTWRKRKWSERKLKKRQEIRDVRWTGTLPMMDMTLQIVVSMLSSFLASPPLHSCILYFLSSYSVPYSLSYVRTWLQHTVETALIRHQGIDYRGSDRERGQGRGQGRAHYTALFLSLFLFPFIVIFERTSYSFWLTPIMNAAALLQLSPLSAYWFLGW